MILGTMYKLRSESYQEAHDSLSKIAAALLNIFQNRGITEVILLEFAARGLVDDLLLEPFFNSTAFENQFQRYFAIFAIFRNEKPHVFAEFLEVLCNLKHCPRIAENFRQQIENIFPGCIEKIEDCNSLEDVLPNYELPSTEATTIMDANLSRYLSNPTVLQTRQGSVVRGTENTSDSNHETIEMESAAPLLIPNPVDNTTVAEDSLKEEQSKIKQINDIRNCKKGSLENVHSNFHGPLKKLQKTLLGTKKKKLLGVTLVLAILVLVVAGVYYVTAYKSSDKLEESLETDNFNQTKSAGPCVISKGNHTKNFTPHERKLANDRIKYTYVKTNC